MTVNGKIAIMEVPYVENGQSKTRPILLWKLNDVAIFYKITSKFANKSDAIRENYFPIMYWKDAGLKKPSFVDLNTRYNAKMFANYPVREIGRLTRQDAVNLEKKISKD